MGDKEQLDTILNGLIDEVDAIYRECIDNRDRKDLVIVFLRAWVAKYFYRIGEPMTLREFADRFFQGRFMSEDIAMHDIIRWGLVKRGVLKIGDGGSITITGKGKIYVEKMDEIEPTVQMLEEILALIP